MILVVGSSGILGSEICRRLTSQGQSVRGLVRSTSNPERVSALKAWGVQTVQGDLKDPVSLAQVCKGVDTVITTATTTISMQPGDSIPATDQQGQLNLVSAAKSAGVKQFVFMSYSKNMDAGPNPCPLTVAKRTVEQAVMNSGMTYTILRPSVFMEIWLSPALGFDYHNAKANIFGDGHGKISYISLGDVAEFTVQSLTKPATQNASFELGGLQAVSPLEVVNKFEQLSGKSFELQFIPVAALQAQKAAATDPLQISFATLMLCQAAGDEVDMRPAQKVFSFPLASVEDYARRVLG
jgi:uncharacterized protein YbjT (DUF2867 family)